MPKIYSFNISVYTRKRTSKWPFTLYTYEATSRYCGLALLDAVALKAGVLCVWNFRPMWNWSTRQDEQK